jgi:hypothetical protein
VLNKKEIFVLSDNNTIMIVSIVVASIIVICHCLSYAFVIVECLTIAPRSPHRHLCIQVKQIDTTVIKIMASNIQIKFIISILINA